MTIFDGSCGSLPSRRNHTDETSTGKGLKICPTKIAGFLDRENFSGTPQTPRHAKWHRDQHLPAIIERQLLPTVRRFQFQQ
jgi:hypothetical protein